MRLISLFITITVFYNPIWGLWSGILGELISVPIRLGSIVINISIPNTGFILLIIYSILFWFGLSELLKLIEKHLKIDILKKTKLRNGMFYSEAPFLAINLPFYLAKIFFPLLIIKGVFVFLLNLVMEIIMGGILGIIGLGGSKIINLITSLLGFFKARFNVDFEFVAISLCILIIIADKFIKQERINRKDEELLNIGKILRKTANIEIPATQDI